MGALILELQAANSTDMSQMPSDPLHAIVILLHSHQTLTNMISSCSGAHSYREDPGAFDRCSSASNCGYPCHGVNGAGIGASCVVPSKVPLLF